MERCQKFIQMSTVKMFGGYFAYPKANETVDKTQIFVSAPSMNQIQCTVDGPGNMGLIAMRTGSSFPVEIIPDVLFSSQISDKHAELLVDSPGPSGFILYVISEGAECEVSINGLGKMILEISHGDLNFIPPK